MSYNKDIGTGYDRRRLDTNLTQKRPEKLNDVLQIVRAAVRNGKYRDTRHSKTRGTERSIDLLDVLEVLENGFHEKKKDEFREDFQNWNYAIRGKTFEGRELRIAVYLDHDLVMIATVIDLSS